jgi:hypothetical protein
MKETIQHGNAIEEGDQTRGWFVGAFIESQGLQKNNSVEIKWANHPKGERHTSKAMPGNATTLGMLVHGCYKINFDNGEEVILKKEGDYAIWNPNIGHSNEALEDTLFITVRWPSLSSEKN